MERLEGLREKSEGVFTWAHWFQYDWLCRAHRPTWGCCIYTLLLIFTPWLSAAKVFLAHPSCLSFHLSLFRCRVQSTWGHRAAGHSVVISISIIALLIIFPLSPKESAVGQRSEMDNRILPPPSQCVEFVRELAACVSVYMPSVYLEMHLHQRNENLDVDGSKCEFEWTVLAMISSF